MPGFAVLYYIIRLGIAAAIVLGIRWLWLHHANKQLMPLAKSIAGFESEFFGEGENQKLMEDDLTELKNQVDQAIHEMNHLFDKGNSYSEILINARKNAAARRSGAYNPAEVKIMASTVRAAAFDHGTDDAEVSMITRYRTALVWFAIMLAMERIIYGFYNFDSYRVLWRTWVQILTGS